MKNIPNPEDTTHGENSSKKRETALAYYDDVVNTLKRLTQLSRSNLSDLESLQADAAKLLEQLSNPKRHRGKLDSKMTKLMSTNTLLNKNKTIVDYLLDGRDVDVVAKITHKAKREVENVQQELVALGIKA